ncbi:TIGR01459 family HAD-type hydrolase [Amylibacter sp. SFDW26]|uniref:TIGR01459 family HAD-type hydrolase n=1 Tax=Amylibacter sp. SFDW26 TaxID=2652722 RepID=UPI001261462B|nr:TIGR01459 family HAD-type hydrolase [Amylibacter sp. SFDW26]KAB7610446.1 TIGR01459 family HAD-type hydrolase [Amylibacter sp. SFDW26]
MTQIIENLSEVSAQYDAVLCDLWGCLHNGIKPFEAAVTALETFRDAGKIVHLLTNSPRPAHSVYTQLDEIGVPRDLYQGITASGDASRAALASGAYGKKVYHVGPGRDEAFFQGVSTEDFYQGIDVERVSLKEAEGLVCTGLFDDSTETPDDYRALFLEGKTRGLKMLCANPDIQVDRGDKRIYCAGAIAQAYNDMGGEAHNFGKPHPPIYTLAYQRLADIAGHKIAPQHILCIGDGINTDIRGAIGEDLDSLFITGGLAATETGTDGQPDPAKLDSFLANVQLTPTYSMGHLR